MKLKYSKDYLEFKRASNARFFQTSRYCIRRRRTIQGKKPREDEYAGLGENVLELVQFTGVGRP